MPQAMRIPVGLQRSRFDVRLLARCRRQDLRFGVFLFLRMNGLTF